MNPSDTSKYCRCNSSSCCCVDCNWLCSRASWGDIAWEGSAAIALLRRTSFYTLQKEKVCNELQRYEHIQSSNTHTGIVYRYIDMYIYNIHIHNIILWRFRPMTPRNGWFVVFRLLNDRSHPQRLFHVIWLSDLRGSRRQMLCLHWSLSFAGLLMHHRPRHFQRSLPFLGCKQAGRVMSHNYINLHHWL